MDIAGRIKQLEDMVAEAKGMPLSSSVLVNREEVLEVLQSIRELLPEEIKQARWVVKDREELLAKARRDAEGIVEEALSEQKRLASKEPVLQRAEADAEQVVADAHERARQIRNEAEDYIDAQLAALEGAIQKVQEELRRSTDDLEGLKERLAKVSQQVQVGRHRLGGGTIAEDELAVHSGEGVEE